MRADAAKRRNKDEEDRRTRWRRRGGSVDRSIRGKYDSLPAVDVDRELLD